MLSQRSLKLSSFLFILFSIFCSVALISTIPSSRPFICSSASNILLLIPSSVFIIHLCLFVLFLGTSLVAQTVKRLPTMRETWVQPLGQEDPLEKEMATHSSTLAWKIPWMEESGRLQSMGSPRVGHN